MKLASLNAKQKVAALLVAFGQDLAADIFKHLSPTERKSVASALQQINHVPAALLDELLAEFYELLQRTDAPLWNQEQATAGILTRALGKEQGSQLLAEIAAASPRLTAVDLVDAPALATILSKEHPQTIALTLAFCDPQKCGQILKRLGPQLQVPVMLRLAALDTVASETVAELDDSLRAQISQLTGQGQVRRGGIEAVAAMLSKMDKDTSASLLGNLAERAPELEQNVRAQMFTFEDLRRLSTRDWQELLQVTAEKDWLVALKLASPELTACFLSAVSSRRAARLQEDLAALPALRKSEVLATQGTLLAALAQLQAKGVISLDEEFA